MPCDADGLCLESGLNDGIQEALQMDSYHRAPSWRQDSRPPSAQAQRRIKIA